MKKIFSILFILMSFAATAQQKHITLRASIDTAYFLTQEHFFNSLDSLVATLGGGTGTVTNVATGLGLSGGPITNTGTVSLDTSSIVVLSRQRAAATYALQTTTITINGVTFDLSANRTWTVSGGLTADSIYFRKLENPNRSFLSSGAGNAGAGLYAGTALNPRHIAIGDSALRGITSGTDNLAMGWKTLQLNSVGASNLAIGNGSLSAMTSATANLVSNNTAIGFEALVNFTASGIANTSNTAIGYRALKNVTTGYSNVGIGVEAMGTSGTITGGGNTAIGSTAMNNATGNISGNVAIGSTAGASLTTSSNIIIGDFAGNGASGNRVLIGTNSGGAARGAGAVGIGYTALYNSTGADGTQIGNGNFLFGSASSVAGFTYIGAFAGCRAAGDENTFIGRYAGSNNATITHTGARNTGLGAYAAYSASTVISGNYNVNVGAYTGMVDATASGQGNYQNVLYIANGYQTASVSSTPTPNGQVGIGASSINASAKVEISSTTQGLLLPRMTSTQASAISSPADGLLIYVTDTNGTFTAVGFWGRVAGAWAKLNN